MKQLGDHAGFGDQRFTVQQVASLVQLCALAAESLRVDDVEARDEMLDCLGLAHVNAMRLLASEGPERAPT